MQNYNENVKAVQATLTCVAIVLGAWWFIARDVYSQRLELETSKYILQCFPNDTALLSIQYRILNVGDRNVIFTFEEYAATNISVPTEYKNNSFSRVQLATLGTTERENFGITPENNGQLSQVRYSVRSKSSQTFWKDFVLSSDVSAVRLEARFYVGYHERWEVSDVYEISSKCQQESKSEQQELKDAH